MSVKKTLKIENPTRLVYHFNSHYDIQRNSSAYERNTMPSLTVPDQSLTIIEIMARYQRGLPIDGGTYNYYSEDHPFPDISKMDLAEREELFEQAKKEFETLKQKMKTDEEKKQYEYYKKMLEKEGWSLQKPMDTDGALPKNIDGGDS